MLAEAEIITLQEASHVTGAQFYPSCVQVRVTSDGKTKLPGGVSFPGESCPCKREIEEDERLTRYAKIKERTSRTSQVSSGRPKEAREPIRRTTPLLEVRSGRGPLVEVSTVFTPEQRLCQVACDEVVLNSVYGIHSTGTDSQWAK